MAGKAAVIGSGIGGGIAAMVLSAAGWQVVVFEKGVSHFTDLTAASPGTLYSKDELKSRRAFGLADSLVDPRTFRRSAAETNPRVVGLVKPCRPRWAAARSSGREGPPVLGHRLRQAQRAWADRRRRRHRLAVHLRGAGTSV